MNRGTDIFCAGELLVDMMTADYVDSFDSARQFVREPGGSPANLCGNMARLGKKTMLSATVGNDDMGRFLKNYVDGLGVDSSGVSLLDDKATSLILVTRSKTIPDFVPYRNADSQLSIRQFPFSKFEDISIFHTTCFGLSKAPARDVLLEAATKAKRAGCKVSIDLNYAEKIWPDRLEAEKVVREYVRNGAIIKVSDVDWSRLMGDQNANPDDVIEYFLKNNASEVCFTMGDKGCWVANDHERYFIPPRPVEVKDTTGAGDAFWSGYLTAMLDEKSIEQCGFAGRKMAELKISSLGPLPKSFPVSEIYEEG